MSNTGVPGADPKAKKIMQPKMGPKPKAAGVVKSPKGRKR